MSEEELNKEELNEDQLDNENDDDSINEELLIDGQGENELVAADNIEDFREKVKRSGVIYISHIPEGMTVGFLREKFHTYGVTRIYLAPENPNTKTSSKKKKTYKEGWVEFPNKLKAKLCEYELNGEQVGGKKTVTFREDLWTIKYLHKFKWHHLIEKMNFSRKMREQRMKAEITQARREANFISEKFEQSKIVNRMAKKRQRDEENQDDNLIDTEDNKPLDKELDNEELDTRFHPDKFKAFQRNFKQRKPILNKK